MFPVINSFTALFPKNNLIVKFGEYELWRYRFWLFYSRSFTFFFLSLLYKNTCIWIFKIKFLKKLLNCHTFLIKSLFIYHNANTRCQQFCKFMNYYFDIYYNIYLLFRCLSFWIS
jgi:hypothetical protein